MKKVLIIFVLFTFSATSYAEGQPSVWMFLMLYGLATTTVTTPTTALIALADADTNTEVFVQNNMDTLTIDIARGEGDTIDALAVLIGVEDLEAFGKRLQSNFNVIYPSYNVGYEHVAYTIVALS